MRQAHIFYKDQLAGILTENDAGYEFCYLPEYLSLEKAKAVSMTLPLQEEAYTTGLGHAPISSSAVGRTSTDRVSTMQNEAL